MSLEAPARKQNSFDHKLKVAFWFRYQHTRALSLALRWFRAHRYSSSRKEQCDWFDNQAKEKQLSLFLTILPNEGLQTSMTALAYQCIKNQVPTKAENNPYGLHRIRFHCKSYGTKSIQQHRLTVHIDVFNMTTMKKLVLSIAIILAL